MAAVNSQTDTDLTLVDNEFDNNAEDTLLRTSYNDFLTEAFDFYWTNAKIWKDNEHDPLYDLLEEKEFQHFTMRIRQAVVMEAYVSRRTYRRDFNKDILLVGHVDPFITSVSCYSLRTKGDFSDFFTWIAYLFELNLFCKVHKFDFEEICKPHFSNYLGFSSFKASAVFGLEKACGLLYTYYSPLVETFHGNYPPCDIFLPFNLAKRTADREFKYDNMFDRLQLLHNKKTCKNISKLHALSSYKPERIALGYISRNKIIPQYESKTTSKESPETDKNLHFAERTQERTEVSSRMLIPNQKSPIEFDDTKSFFTVSNRYLSKRQKATFSSYEFECKCNIKLYSKDNGKTELVEGLMNVLEENIHKNNLYQIADELFAVYPLNSDANFGDKIIVLDTSSDDEDDNQLDPSQKVFMSSLIPALKKRKYITTSYHERVKDIYKLREEFKRQMQSKPQNDEEKEVNTINKGVIRKEMESTVQNLGIGKRKKRKRKKN